MNHLLSGGARGIGGGTRGGGGGASGRYSFESSKLLIFLQPPSPIGDGKVNDPQLHPTPLSPQQPSHTYHLPISCPCDLILT